MGALEQYTLEELIPVVGKLTNKYTGYETTSITYETAEMLMEAVIYCINELSKGNSKSLCDQHLSAERAYELGYKAVVSKTESALIIYKSILSNFKDYGSRAYYDTIIKGMPAFFKNYNPEFEPQNEILTLDYPLMKPIKGEQGIDLIYNYLIKTKEEQDFLSKYNERDVRDALKNYHFLGGELFVNVMEVFMEMKKRLKSL